MNPVASTSGAGPESVPIYAGADAERRLRVLYELSDRAARARRVDDVFAATLDAIQRAGLAERASVLIFDADGVMRFKDSRGLSPQYRRAVEGHTPWSPDTPDPKPILVPDVTQDPELAPYQPVFASENIRALGFFPLVHDARVLGKFMLYYATPHPFSQDEVLLAQTIAGHVSNALGRARAETAVRQSEEHFRVLADVVPQIVWTATPDGALDYYNRRWLEYTGRSLDETTGWKWRDYLHPEDVERTVEVWSNSVRTGEAYEIQYRLRRADGEHRWHLGRATPVRNAEGAVVRWFGTCTDIHDQKLAEAALRESEERFRLLSNSSPIGIFLALPTGEARYTNPSCDRICGFQGDQSGFGWANYVHPEDRERVLAQWIPYSRSGAQPFHSQFRWLHKDGTVRYSTVRAAPMLRNGETIGHVGTVEDVTEIRHAAEELDRTRAQLAHNEKLSALGSLVGGVAHELRTPLTYLANNLAIIERSVDRALAEVEPARADAVRARLRGCLADAEESIDRINRIVEDLRKYTRLKPGTERRPLALDAVVREAVELFRAARRGRVHVVAELAPTALAKVDRVQVQQIVINLLENALEANPKDATVRIATRTLADGWVALVVEDKGEGMPAEVQARMWDPFYTTKAHGSGLGLSIVRRIADEHGARIGVDSRPGQGTAVTIAFPPA
ncbi:MAG TPA: PAS domain S-box protein [Candidatus Thermoplasmatota archaeon]|nr:PAS domain S-box protein [Candidatus Thermoplasmatota archaeon]